MWGPGIPVSEKTTAHRDLAESVTPRLVGLARLPKPIASESRATWRANESFPRSNGKCKRFTQNLPNSSAEIATTNSASNTKAVFVQPRKEQGKRRSASLLQLFPGESARPSADSCRGLPRGGNDAIESFKWI
jgi:hypothetical protein